MAADDLGDGEEGTPLVGEAVVGGRGITGRASREGGEIVLGPTGEFAAEGLFGFNAALIETGQERRAASESEMTIERWRNVGKDDRCRLGDRGIGFEGTGA
jgi:hypothetical protein